MVRSFSRVTVAVMVEGSGGGRFRVFLGGGFDVLGADERTDGDDEEQGDNAVEPEGFLLAGGGGAHGVPSLGARTETLLSVPFGLRGGDAVWD